MDKSLVSILLPTYNSEKTLAKCLESIKNQNYNDIEAIIVDGFSKDKTVEIAKNYGVRVIQGYLNKPEARNIGILNSNGEYIFIADSDFVFEKGLVTEVLKCFEEEGCDAVFVPEKYMGDSFLRRCKNLEKRIDQAAEAIEAPRVYKKWVFARELFDERNDGPDEYDFYLNATKLGLRKSRVNSKILLIESPLNLRKKFRHGKYFAYYTRKHRKEDMVRKQTSFSYRASLILKAFKWSKTEALGLVILKTLEFSAFMLGWFTGVFDRTIQRLLVDVKEEFDTIGENYEVTMYRGTLGNEFVDKIERGAIARILKGIFNDERIRVLDVGAGTGRWSREFLKLGYDVTSLDISEKMCEHLRKSLSGLKVVSSSIESTELREKYDLVFSFRSFKYVMNRERALENMRNIAKEDGYVILEMANKYNPFYFITYVTAPIIHALTRGKIGKYFILADFVSEKEFREDLEKLGFNTVGTEKLFFFPHKVYSKINNKHLLRLMYGLDKALSRVFPRSVIFVARNVCMHERIKTENKEFD